MRFNSLVHFTEDIQTPIFSLSQCNLHDLFGNTVDLDVHLQRIDAISGTGHFEVHVTQMIFVTQDIGQNSKLITFLDQTHGNTSNRRLDRHTSVHQ